MDLEKSLSSLSSDLDQLRSERISNLRNELSQLKSSVDSLESRDDTFFDILGIKYNERKNTRILYWLLENKEEGGVGVSHHDKIKELFFPTPSDSLESLDCFYPFQEFSTSDENYEGGEIDLLFKTSQSLVGVEIKTPYSKS